MMAAHNGNLSIVKMLIDLTKANVTLKDAGGRTARDYAVSKGHLDVVKYFDGEESESDDMEEDSLADDSVRKEKADHVGTKGGMAKMSTRALRAKGLMGGEDDTSTASPDAISTNMTANENIADSVVSAAPTTIRPVPVWVEVKECIDAETVDAKL